MAAANKFANFEKLCQSWYVLCRSADLRMGQAQTIVLQNFTFIIKREPQKILCFNALGASLPYEIIEKFNLIFLFPAGERLFDLPQVDDKWPHYLLPKTQIDCHPHLLVVNGLDLNHYGPVHGLLLKKAKVIDQDKHNLKIELELALPKRGVLNRLLALCYGQRISAQYTITGGSLASISARLRRIRFFVLFTHRPEGKKSQSQTAIALQISKKWRYFFRCDVVLLFYVGLFLIKLLKGDRRLLEGNHFHQNHIAQDAMVAKGYGLINKLPLVKSAR